MRSYIIRLYKRDVYKQPNISYTNNKHMFKMVGRNWSREKLKLTKSERVAFVVPGRITIDSQYSPDDSQCSPDGNYSLASLNIYLQEWEHLRIEQFVG